MGQIMWGVGVRTASDTRPLSAVYHVRSDPDGVNKAWPYQPPPPVDMSLPTVARELEVALGHPGPDRPRHHWVYRTGEVNDYEEYGKVHDSIIELWEAMQKGEVTDEKSFKGWIGQAKELSVSF